MSSRILAGSVWLFLAGVVVAAAAFPVSSGDVWWHVAAGDYILASRSVPTRDVFSFSALGRPWVSHEWLFEVLLSLVFRLGGPAAAVIFKTALVLGTFALLGLALRRLKVDTLVAAPLLLLAASLLTFRAFVRPHVATELMLAVFLLVLFSDQGRGARRYFWLLVPVQLVWANLHAGAVLGPMVVLLFALGAGISRLVRRGRPEEPGDAGRHRTGLLFLLAGVLAAVTLANPSTWRPLLYPLFLSGSSTFTGSITELQSPLARAYWGADFFVCLVILAVGGAGSFVLARRLDPTRLLLFLVFGAAALLALRNVPLFAIVAVPVVALNVGSRLAVPAGPRLRAVLLAALTLLSAGLLWRTLTAGVRLPGGALRRPGLGVAAGAFPERAAGFVAANPIAGNVLNTMEFGGYLVWRWFPQRRVFVDGRLDVYGPAFFERYRRALWSGPQFDSIVREYDIGCALLACPPRLDGSTEHYLGRTLALRPDWSLVHWDDVALVYVRNTESNRPVVERHRYSALVPLLLWPEMPDSTEPSPLVSEARRAVAADSTSSRAHTALGFALLRAGSPAPARAEFEAALRLNPAAASALQGLAMARVAAGDRAGTVAALSRLVKLTPAEPSTRYNLGYALWQNGDSTGARRQFERALRLNPRMVPAHNALAELALARGDVAQAREHTEAVLRLDAGNPHARTRLQRLRSTGPGR